MKTPNSTRLLLKNLSYALFISSIFLVSCSSDGEVDEEVFSEDINNDDSEQNEDDGMEEETNEESSSCSNPEDFVFLENDGLVVVEFESAAFSGDWEQRDDEPDFSGKGFMVWTGDQSLQNPGNGLTTFKIEIQTPGTYQFLWNSAITIGNQSSEHNDTWLRFNDADDFFGQKSNSIVYPVDSGKTPNPNGSSRDGWFKIYRSGNDLAFKWQAKTSDNDAHDIFVTFNSPGIYTMEVSARSSGHAIDKFVLFTEDYSVAQATEEATLSEIDCN